MRAFLECFVRMFLSELWDYRICLLCRVISPFTKIYFHIYKYINKTKDDDEKDS